MRIFRSSRAVLALNGIIMIMIGLFFFIFPEKITIITFPKIISNPEALETGVVLRYLMGAGQLAVGIILYLARISIKSGAQRLLLGSGIGFMIIFATAVFIIIKYQANIPILCTGYALNILNSCLNGLKPIPTRSHSTNDNSESSFHRIFISPGSKLASILGSGGFVRVNSRHSYSITEAQKSSNLIASAYSLDDGIIDFPDLKISIEHMNYPNSDEILAMMSRSKNVYSDTAFLLSEHNPLAHKTYLRGTTILTFNLVKAKELGVIDKIMYGTDYAFSEPVDLKREVHWFRELLNEKSEKCGWETFTEEEIEGILGNNAKRFYDIK